jgi:integrase
MKLTKRTIDALECPAGRREVLAFDDETRGFGIRITNRGAKVFLFEYWHSGRTHRMRIGRYGDLTATEGRRMAEALRGEVARGGHPAGQRQAERAARKQQGALDILTLGGLVDRWETMQLRHRSERYRREAVRAIRTTLARLLDRPAGDLTASTLQAVIDEVPRRSDATQRDGNPRGGQGEVAVLPDPTGTVMARRVHSYARAMFGWAVSRNLVATNPLTGVIVEGSDKPRERWLDNRELAEVWIAAGTLGWPWGPYLRFLLLTLQRTVEVAGLRWEELSEDRATWTLPGSRTKNGKAHVVPLSEPARAILAAAERMPGSGLVFTTTGKTPISGFSHAKVRLDRAITKARQAASGGDGPANPMVPWRLHDFRRTGVTQMADLGIGWEVADRILNHTQGAIRDVAAIYQRHDFMRERTAALNTWAAHVLAQAEGMTIPSNVVSLRGGI